jgi:hypothetical protein
MRALLASLLILGALGAGLAHANRWDQQQQQQQPPQRPSFFAADRGERRPLFQRRQAEPVPPTREAPRFQTPQAAPQTAPAAPANAPPRLQPGEAGRRAQQQYGGRVLSVAPADSGYHVRLLRDGEVSVVTVPNQ